jgi:small-conductance mechanosensitive channel
MTNSSPEGTLLQTREHMLEVLSRSHLEEDVCIHVFNVSAAMVGVCTTVIGLIRIVITLGKFDTIADDLLAADAIVFLLACFFSYWALRTRKKQRMHKAERVADMLFLAGLALMVVVCLVFAYAMTSPGLLPHL